LNEYRAVQVALLWFEHLQIRDRRIMFIYIVKNTEEYGTIIGIRRDSF